MTMCGLAGPTWGAWRAAAKAMAALPMTRDERATYEQCTGRTTAPREPARESWFLVGRRGGKSRFAGALGVDAARKAYPALAAGERAVVGVAASDREQARVVLGYVTAPFRAESSLRPLVQEARRAQPRALGTRDD